MVAARRRHRRPAHPRPLRVSQFKVFQRQASGHRISPAAARSLSALVSSASDWRNSTKQKSELYRKDEGDQSGERKQVFVFSGIHSDFWGVVAEGSGGGGFDG